MCVCFVYLHQEHRKASGERDRLIQKEREEDTRSRSSALSTLQDILTRLLTHLFSVTTQVYIRDLKSSNGTFLNGRRLSAESVESDPFILNQNDSLEFGIDIMDEGGSCKSFFYMSNPTTS